MRARQPAVLVAIALALVAAPAGARADSESRSVAVVLPPCLDTPTDAVRSLLAIELGGTLVDDTAGALHVTAACRGAKVYLELSDRDSGLTLVRAIDLGAVAPEARARVLSVSIGELIAAARSELQDEPMPSPDPSPREVDPPASTVAAAASARPPRWRLAALLESRHFATPGYWSGGGALVAERDLGPGALAADLAVEQGIVGATLGNVRVTSASLGLALLLRQRGGPVSLEAGAGVRVGVARMSGEPFNPSVAASDYTAAWGGPVAVGRIVGPGRGRFLVWLGFEAGYAAIEAGALVDGSREVAIDNFWLTVQLGVGGRL